MRAEGRDGWIDGDAVQTGGVEAAAELHQGNWACVHAARSDSQCVGVFVPEWEDTDCARGFWFRQVWRKSPEAQTTQKDLKVKLCFF